MDGEHKDNNAVIKEGEVIKNTKLPDRIFLILGDGKPMYYFFEVFLIKELRGTIDENVAKICNPFIIPLPVIQIMFNDPMFKNRGVAKPYIIKQKIEEIERVTYYLHNDAFNKVIELYKKLLKKPYDNMFTIQPYLRPSLIIQELKHGEIDLSFAYIALHRSPESYHTLIRLLELIDRIYEENNEKTNIEIFIFSKESHLNYLTLQEVINVLNNLSNQYRRRNYRISGIHYAVLHEEIDELRKIFVQNINLLGENFDTISYLNMRVPLYDLISELYASLMRIYTPENKLEEKHEINGYRLQLCTPDKPYSLLIRILYELYKMRKSIDKIRDTNKVTIYVEPIIVDKDEYIVEPDIHFLTIHRCPRFRPLQSISGETNLTAINKSGHYIVSCKLILKIKRKKHNSYRDIPECKQEKDNFEYLRYYDLYSPKNPYRNIVDNIGEEYEISKSCIDRRICPLSTFYRNYIKEPLRNSPLASSLIENHYSQDVVKVRKVIINENGEEDPYIEENYETVAEVSLKLWACLREQPFSFIRFLMSLYPWSIDILEKRINNEELVMFRNLKELLNKKVRDLEALYSVIAGVSHECLTKYSSLYDVERRNFSELYFVKNMPLIDIINKTGITMDRELAYPVEKVFFLITDIEKSDRGKEVSMYVISSVLMSYFMRVLENVLFFSRFEEDNTYEIRYEYNTNMDIRVDNCDLLGKYYMITRKYFSCDEYLCILAKIKPFLLANDFYIYYVGKEGPQIVSLGESLEKRNPTKEKIKEIYRYLTALSNDAIKKRKLCQLLGPRILIPVIKAEVLEVIGINGKEHNDLEHQGVEVRNIDPHLLRVGSKLGDIKRLNIKLTKSELRECLKRIYFVEFATERLCDLNNVFEVDTFIDEYIINYIHAHGLRSLYDYLFKENSYYGKDLDALLYLINYHDRKISDLNYIIDKIRGIIGVLRSKKEDITNSYMGLRVLLQEISEIKHIDLMRTTGDKMDILGSPVRDVRILKNLYDLILG